MSSVLRRRIPGHVMLSGALFASIGVLLFMLLPIKHEVEHDPLAMPGPDAPLTPALALLPHEKPHDLLSLVKSIVDLNAGMSMEEMNAVGGMNMEPIYGSADSFRIRSVYLDTDYALYSSEITHENGREIRYYRINASTVHSKCGMKIKYAVEKMGVRSVDKLYVTEYGGHLVTSYGRNLPAKIFIGDNYKVEMTYDGPYGCVERIYIIGVGVR